MRKWIKRIGIVIIVLVVILFIGVNWIIREAFGPKYRTLKVPVNDRQTLIGDETYNADFAAVFYDVEFTLETTNEGTHNLGRASFSDEHWNKDIRLYNISNWFVLPVNDGSYTKILFANKIDRKSKDTIFLRTIFDMMTYGKSTIMKYRLGLIMALQSLNTSMMINYL